MTRCNELRTQAETVTVTCECECGCGTVGLQVEKGLSPANLEKSIPIEAYADALDVLLFARDGYLSSLEIVYYGQTPERPYPRPD